MLRSICAATLLIAVSAASVHADEFLSQEGDMWRASKLVGVNVYGPDQKKVGDINDVLMSKEGKAAYVVVGVGGFLGIGEKNVAIPYDKVTFTQEPINPPVATGTAAPPTATMGANPEVSSNGTAGLGLPARTDAMGTAPATGGGLLAAARSTAYPDHGMVTYTADQLKAAPTFAYAK